MGADAFVPGNHVADAGNAEVDIDGWHRAIMRIRTELNRDIPGVAANIEVPKYPGFAGPEGEIYRPYRVVEIPGAGGQTERVGVVGLVTHELTDAAKMGDITYLNPEKSAEQWISHLNKPVSEGGEGINKVIVLSHLGRNEDVSLARNVKGISYIVSAHSHDAEPVILWGKNAQTGWDVPILQAGSQAKWLAQTDLTFKPTGAADKYRTFGQLHRIDSSVPHDPAIRDFLHQNLGPMLDLENHKLPAEVVGGSFHIDGARGSDGSQTPLGYLISKGVKEGVNRRLPALNQIRAQEGLEPLEPVTIMLKHTGEIREELPQGVPSVRSVAKMFLNTGSVERETRELAIAKLSGDELQKVLNFGVEDFPRPMHIQEERGWSKVARSFKDIFAGPPETPHHDYPGNFLQTDGLRYSIDLSKPPGARVSNIEVLDAATNQYVAVDPSKEYRVLTYNHPIEKWNKNGVFGPELKAAGEQAIRQHVDAQSIPLSQVDLMSEWLENHPRIAPSDYVSDNITNLTPPAWRPTVKPTPGTIGGIATDAATDR
jgi:5'-nucleotidase/UDP-sugar diphosphatase